MAAEGLAVPLNENEQRILAEIERQFRASDEEYARRLGNTTLRGYLARNCRWAAAGFTLGLIVLLVAFAINPLIGVAGFLIMVASTVVLVQNLRRMSRLGIEQVSRSLGGGFSEAMDDLGRRIRRRLGREDS